MNLSNSARLCIELAVQGSLPSTVDVLLEDGRIAEVLVEYPGGIMPQKKKKQVVKKYIKDNQKLNTFTVEMLVQPVLVPV